MDNPILFANVQIEHLAIFIRERAQEIIYRQRTSAKLAAKSMGAHFHRYAQPIHSFPKVFHSLVRGLVVILGSLCYNLCIRRTADTSGFFHPQFIRYGACRPDLKENARFLGF